MLRNLETLLPNVPQVGNSISDCKAAEAQHWREIQAGYDACVEPLNANLGRGPVDQATFDAIMKAKKGCTDVGSQGRRNEVSIRSGDYRAPGRGELGEIGQTEDDGSKDG